jgi:hypothetical protein
MLERTSTDLDGKPLDMSSHSVFLLQFSANRKAQKSFLKPLSSGADFPIHRFHSTTAFRDSVTESPKGGKPPLDGGCESDV